MEVSVAIVERVAAESIPPAAVEDSSVAPIKTPPAPSPAEPEERAYAETNAEGDVRAGNPHHG